MSSVNSYIALCLLPSGEKYNYNSHVLEWDWKIEWLDFTIKVPTP